jgi:CheY-like chemotaxis protein/EAL domain-containing protein (putative c-di-GMP-specific phosphodiesterase class I)/GGDEF domain-containing protein
MMPKRQEAIQLGERALVAYHGLLRMGWRPEEARNVHQLLEQLSDIAFNFEITTLIDPALEFGSYLSSFVDTPRSPSEAQQRTLNELAQKLLLAVRGLAPPRQPAAPAPAPAASTPPPVGDRTAPMAPPPSMAPAMPAKPAGPAAEPAAKIQVYSLQRPQALPIDLNLQLDQRGYALTTFSDASVIELMLAAKPPQALICDIQFLAPLSDIVDRRFSTAGRRQFPIIAVNPDQSTEQPPGADAYLQRPSSADVLIVLERLFNSTAQEVRGRVLIVDDDLQQLMFCESVLRRQGFITATASSGAEALEHLPAFKPDLLLVDLYMPGLDGVQLTQKVREQTEALLVPIIFLTGESDQQKRFEALGAGGDDYLVKPIRPAHLVSAVVTRLDRARQLKKRIEEAGRKNDRGALPRSELLKEAGRRLAAGSAAGSVQGLILLTIDQGAQLLTKLALLSLTELNDAITMTLRRKLGSNDLLALWQDFAFGVLVTRVSEIELRRTAEALIEAIRNKPMLIGGQEAVLTASAGFVSDRIAQGQLERWVNSTLSANHLASRKGGNQVEGGVGGVPEGMSMEQATRLRTLLSETPGKGNVLLEFQPLVQLRGQTADQYEVFVRLRDQDANQVVPAALYRGIARDLGVQDRIDAYALHTAIELLGEHTRAGKSLRLIVKLAVQAVGDQLLDELSRQRSLWSREGISLCVLMDADAAMLDVNHHVEACQALHAMGIRIALGRIGGQPNLPVLFDRMAFDLAFIRREIARARDLADVRKITKLATEFGREVVAPGIEDASAVAQLWSCGVHYLQGDFIRPPGPRLDYDFHDINM